MNAKAALIRHRFYNLTLAKVAMRCAASRLREMCAAAGRRARAGDS